MENNKNNSNNDWYKRYLSHCEGVEISKTITHLFSHLQELQYDKIIKKLQIPGYETKVIIKPRKNQGTKRTDGVQLSLEIEMEQIKSAKAK
ncbi:hypothetical protein [Metabacillus malikii]|uniref:Uncharacterized protein n=1 Tax=Metabacillus malikii TaxID=1504265 RepID=A0ABT9ZM49_9BACI|nr:hypothetical protein [Metabacillus malikii]MDQ0232866.1 hypothetical protein [Metabacillus malikii]